MCEIGNDGCWDVHVLTRERRVCGDKRRAKHAIRLRQILAKLEVLVDGNSLWFSTHGIDFFDIVGKILQGPGDVAHQSKIISDTLMPSLAEVAVIRRHKSKIEIRK